MTALALDPVFVLTGPDGGSAQSDVASLGLVETRRVKHRGQGTPNRCYAFENACLELLWIEEAIRHPLLFETQGGVPPAQWPPAMGPLQRGAGLHGLAR